MANNDYPTEAQLKWIREWDFSKNQRSKTVSTWRDYMEFVRSCWWMADWGFRETQRSYYLSTGGWSGNEDIIRAMSENFLFWSMCFYSHRVGGHYVFRVKRILADKEASHGRVLDSGRNGRGHSDRARH